MKGRASGAADEKPSIAVLPFSNVTANKEDEFFSDGVTEEIINSLSRIQNDLIPFRAHIARSGDQTDE